MDINKTISVAGLAHNNNFSTMTSVQKDRIYQSIKNAYMFFGAEEEDIKKKVLSETEMVIDDFEAGGYVEKIDGVDHSGVFTLLLPLTNITEEVAVETVMINGKKYDKIPSENLFLFTNAKDCFYLIGKTNVLFGDDGVFTDEELGLGPVRYSRLTLEEIKKKYTVEVDFKAINDID